MKKQLKNIVEKYFIDKSIDLSALSLEILKTKDEKFGDYTTNVAMKMSKQLSKNPIEIAEDIKIYLEQNHSELFDTITVTNPGFVNMFLSKDFILNEATKYFEENYKADFQETGNKINYEFISANPTGDLHIGHARNAIVGDITTRLMEYVGDTVDREYYINDAGNQINTLAESVYYYVCEEQDIQGTLTKESVGYHGDEIVEFAKLISKEIDFTNLSQEEGIEKLKEVSKEYFLERIWNLINEMNIKAFDFKTSEKKLFEEGKVQKQIESLQNSGKVYQSESATWLKTEEYGDDKDRVLIKEDGSFTYMVADIANHVQRLSRGYDLIFNLWGADHHGYESRILASLEILGQDPNKVKTDFISMVSLEQDGKPVKMSKREGTSLRIKEIIELIDVDIFKFFIISKSKEQSLVIDVDFAKEKNQENPYFYVQYAHARINQIMEKANLEISKSTDMLGEEKAELDLAKKMNEFEDYITTAYEEREPYQLVIFARELSQAINSFYSACKVIGVEEELSKQRLYLIKSAQNQLKQIFGIIGIEAKGTM